MPRKGQRVTTKDFRLLEGAKAHHAPHLFVLCGASDNEHARFSVVVSKKIAKTATARNRIKRRVREIVKKEILHSLSSGTLLVVHAKKGIEELSGGEILNELQAAL